LGIIWFSIFDCLQHFFKAEYIFGSHKVVTKHNEVHFTIYFLQSLQQGMCVTPMSFYTAKRMFANGLPSFIIVRVLFNVVIININRILVFTALYNTFGKFGTLAF